MVLLYFRAFLPDIMDSLSQIVLGAAVGEAVLGKKAGNRAPLWGAVAGTIPDLDVFIPYRTEIMSMAGHRGFSHSILFCMLLAPVLGWLVYRLYKGREGNYKEWSWLFFLALVTHPLLDSFTTWGTQLFWPFWDYRVAFNSIFVADPVYTLPFLLTMLVVLFLRRENRWRTYWNRAGLIFSCGYLMLTLVNKATVNLVFENSLHLKGSSVLRYSTYPTPLNNILWYVVAEEPSGYQIGYYSLLGDPQRISYVYIPKGHRLLDGREDNIVIEKLKWMSQGYYSIESQNDTLLWHDLRFGLMSGISVDPPPIVSTLRLLETDCVFTDIVQEWPEFDFRREDLLAFRDQIMGKGSL
jgi:inner membrane protein